MANMSLFSCQFISVGHLPFCCSLAYHSFYLFALLKAYNLHVDGALKLTYFARNLSSKLNLYLLALKKMIADVKWVFCRCWQRKSKGCPRERFLIARYYMSGLFQWIQSLRGDASNLSLSLHRFSVLKCQHQHFKTCLEVMRFSMRFLLRFCKKGP
jgi:hypothetical protein